MQNLYFHEIETAYRRHRLQEGVVAAGRAAQALPPRTTRRHPFMPTLILAFRRAGEVFQRQRPALQPIPDGNDLPAS
jgi:hypothetical protein